LDKQKTSLLWSRYIRIRDLF